MTICSDDSTEPRRSLVAPANAWWRSHLRRLLLSLLITTVIWAVFSWPLPRYASSGIPSSSQNIEKSGVRRMIPGDHLQLTYYYWLFADMLRGETPLFFNLYEFNTGCDEDRYEPGTYNIPFSLLYAACAQFGTRALAWNLTSLIVLWLTYLATWFLLRCHTDDEWVAGAMATVSITLPYGWMSLLGGSPTGFAMLWIPLLTLGLDLAVRRGSPAGGLLAGLAIYGASQNDTHVFFFGLMFMPAWCVIAGLSLRDIQWRDARWWLQRVKGVAPAPLIAGAVAVKALATKKEAFGDTTLAAGRELGEVAAFTPRAVGLIGWQLKGTDSHAYIGFILPLLLIGGCLVLMYRNRRQLATGRDVLLLLMLVVLATVVVCAGLGPNGPFDGLLFRLSRRCLPGYEMVRQAGKVYCLLPTLLAVAAARIFASSREHPGGSRYRWVAVMLSLLFVVEYSAQVEATVCQLDARQGAYEAVAQAAADRDEDPRALILPLWPGDSAWASLYEYYISLYRIRMVNGYRPVVPKDYVETVFEQLGPANVGVLPNSVVDALLAKGIRSVILHENAFPEMVSPFPVAFTIKRFMNHPRMRLLAQDENVWAFELLDLPRRVDPCLADWDAFFPTQTWEMEWQPNRHCTASESDDSAGGIYLTMSQPDATADLPRFGHWQTPDARLRLRARGTGHLRVILDFTSESPHEQTVLVDSANWSWVDVELDWPRDSFFVQPTVVWVDGKVDVDVAFFSAGPPVELDVDEAIVWPAAVFFHAGYTDLANSSVRLRPDYEPDDAILYGPRLPLAMGEYEVVADVRVNGEGEGVLGYISVEQHGEKSAPLAVSEPGLARLTYRQRTNLPVRFVFTYTRNRDVEIRSVGFRRVAPAGTP